MHLLPLSPRRVLLARGVMTYQAIGVRYTLEDIVGRVTEYVDEYCLTDKCHLR